MPDTCPGCGCSTEQASDTPCRECGGGYNQPAGSVERFTNRYIPHADFCSASKTTEPQHADYPHEPGRLAQCPACDARCHCTANAAECVFEGEHNGLAQLNLRLARDDDPSVPAAVLPGTDYEVVTDDGQRVGWVIVDDCAQPEAYNAAGEYIGEASTPELAAAMVRQPPMPQHCDLEGPHRPHESCPGITIEQAAAGEPSTGPNADGNPYTPYTPEHRVWAKAQLTGVDQARLMLDSADLTQDAYRVLLAKIPQWRSQPGSVSAEPRLVPNGAPVGYTHSQLLQDAGWVPHDGTALAGDLVAQYPWQARIAFWNEVERRCLAALPHGVNGDPVDQLGQRFITCRCGHRESGGIGDGIAERNMDHHLKTAREARDA